MDEITLATLSAQKTRVLFDASFLKGYLSLEREDSIYRELQDSIINTDFMFSVIEHLAGGSNFYTTEGVLSELMKRGYNFRRKVRGNGHSRNRVVLDMQRQTQREAYAQRKLAEAFQDHHRVFHPNPREREAYDKFTERYGTLVEKFGLTDVDFEYLRCGNTYAKTNLEPIILATNDVRGITRLGKRILYHEGETAQRLVQYLIRNAPYSFDIPNGHLKKNQPPVATN